MDALYQYGVSRLYSQLSAQAIQRLGWLCRVGHMDSTRCHVDGNYHSNETPQEGVVHIVPGYSREHRPELNQVVLQLVTEFQAGIPLLRPALNGNHSDKESFHGMVKAFTEPMRGSLGIEYRVADSALYTADHLKSMETLWWISRVPETLGLARDVIEVLAPEWMHDPTRPAYRGLEVEYGEVKQRWVVVFSPEAHQRASKTLNRQWQTQSHAELKNFNKLCQQNFAGEADARNALITFKNTLKVNQITEANLSAISRFKDRGRPALERQPDYFDYRIVGAMASNLQPPSSKPPPTA